MRSPVGLGWDRTARAACRAPALGAAGAGVRPRGKNPRLERRQTAQRAAHAARVSQHRTRVGQPSFIQSSERPRPPEAHRIHRKWNVDIGDKAKKGRHRHLYVPELVEDFATKRATVKLDEERAQLAAELVEVADADVKVAEASLDEAKAILAKYDSEVDRWESEVQRAQARSAARRGRSPDPPRIEQSVALTPAAQGAAKATIEKVRGAPLPEGQARESRG